MSMMRRYAAALVAALALTLGACGGETLTSADPGPTDGAVVDNIRNYSIQPGTVTFTRLPGGPFPTGSMSVLYQGIIALGSVVQTGAIQYGPGASGWLLYDQTPTVSLNPYGIRHSMRLAESAMALPEGRYEAWIPVNVPGALNNPQMLTVVYDYCGNCLFLGDSKMAELSPSSPRWDRGSDINAPGDYAYFDWRLFVEPGQTVYVQQMGNPSSPCSQVPIMGTQSDPYLYLFSTSGTFLQSDDDSCGYNSELVVTNGGATTMEYLVRSTQYCDVFCDSPGYSSNGTFTVRVTDSPYFPTLRAEMTPEQKAAHEAGKRRPSR